MNKMTIKITDKKVEQEELPKNEFKIVTEWGRVSYNEELITWSVSSEDEEEFEEILEILSFLYKIKEDWNMYSDLNPFEFDEYIIEWGYNEEYVNGETLSYLPQTNEYDQGLGKFIGAKVTYFDENSVEYECELQFKKD